MSFHLVQITKESDFDKMIPAFWEGYSTPRNAIFELMNPVKDQAPESYAAALDACKKRWIATWKSSPQSRFFQVLDSENDDAVAGACCWNIYNEKNNPFARIANGEVLKRTVDRSSKGSVDKKFMLNQGMLKRIQRQKRPHLELGFCFTVPKYRQKGVEGLLVGWGTNKADELGVECFLEASEVGVPLYAHSGFLVVDRTEIDLAIEDPSEKWKEFEKYYQPLSWNNMWRGVGGSYRDGDKYPWEG